MLDSHEIFQIYPKAYFLNRYPCTEKWTDQFNICHLTSDCLSSDYKRLMYKNLENQRLIERTLNPKSSG